MANPRRKTTTLTIPVLDCDECGKEIWEMAAHSVYAKPSWELPWDFDRDAPHRELCEDCCPHTCIDAENHHG